MNPVKLVLASVEAYVPNVFEHDKDGVKDGTFDVSFNVIIPEQSGNPKADKGDVCVIKHTVNSANPKAKTLKGAQSAFSGEVTIDADSPKWVDEIGRNGAWVYAVIDRQLTFTPPVKRQPAAKATDAELGL